MTSVEVERPVAGPVPCSADPGWVSLSPVEWVRLTVVLAARRTSALYVELAGAVPRRLRVPAVLALAVLLWAAVMVGRGLA